MKFKKICPKCNSTDIVVVPEKTVVYRYIPVGIISNAYVEQYICCECGYLEEYVPQKDIKYIKKKYQK